MSTYTLGDRDRRMLRAANSVLKDYQFTSIDRLRTRVSGGTTPYEVTAHPDWSARPSCTCPDHQGAAAAGYCKHIIAVLMRDRELQCQLLELFL
jgi:uncharacterized Zn finger protein